MSDSPFKMPGSRNLGRGNQSVSPGKYTASPAKQPENTEEVETPVEETEEEFLAKLKKSGGTILPEHKVKMSDHMSQRDILAEEAGKNRSGNVRKGMEGAARRQNYRDADNYMKSDYYNKNR